MKKIGLIANLEKPSALRIARNILRDFKGCTFFFEEELGARLRVSKNVFPLSELAKKVELFLLLGGDGTVLRVVRHIYPVVTKILPVNLGRLRFLTSLSPRNLNHSLRQILNGDFSVSTRTTLEV